MNKWLNRHVLVIGAARQGQALARHLSREGAKVILNDQKSYSALRQIASRMSDLGVKCVFGSHPLDLLSNVDLVSLSGGIPENNPLILEAKERLIPLTNDTQVFLEEVSAQVIGITGSAGKTTTTSLTGKILEHTYKKSRKIWVGGNIGLPLVDKLDRIKDQDLVVLEISSFQLEQMTLSPHIAAVLNITPNHLDRHGTFDAYVKAKSRLITFQKSDDFCVLNRDDPESWTLKDQALSKVVSFGFSKPEAKSESAYIENEDLVLDIEGKKTLLLPISQIKIRGKHNIANVLAACTISHLAGATPEAMRQTIRTFPGVQHRLEFVREFKGAKWYNDSIATAPERTIAAINSFEEPIVLMLGGRDKNLPWEQLADLIHHRVDHVVIFGEAAPKINMVLGKKIANSRLLSVFTAISLRDAINAAAEITKPGSVVLFSPGGTSFDEFKDFEERGEKFRKWVNQLL